MEQTLSQYRQLQAEITSLERQIDKLEMLARSPRITNLTGMPRAGRVTDGMDIIAKIEDLRDKYYSKLNLFLDLQAIAESTLAELGHEERTVIRYKYIEGMRNCDIAERLYCSESTVKRRMRAAMKKLKEESNNV